MSKKEVHPLFLQAYGDLWDCSASLPRNNLLWCNFQTEMWFLLWEPLGPEGAVPMGPAPALVPSAGRDAGTPLLGWKRNMLPSFLLLKPGNKEG